MPFPETVSIQAHIQILFSFENTAKKTDVTLDNGKRFGLLQHLVFIILTHNLAFIRWQTTNGTANSYLNSG